MFKHFVLSLVMMSGLMQATDNSAITMHTTYEDDTLVAAIMQNIITAVNPVAYAAAVNEAYKAGFGNICSTLYKDHKAVLVGSVVITTAALTALAYSQGWFAKAQQSIQKAKAWATERLS